MDDWFGLLQQQAQLNNSWSAEQAQKQMDFQERMSNTAHQREMADLKAAGLNPVLSAKLGGASTPSGNAASADTSIVSAMVQLMDKMLDVSGTSAAAAYNASGGSGYTAGSYGSSASSLTNKEQAGLARLIDEGKGVSADSVSAINKIGFAIGEEIADATGMAEDSAERKYLTGNWNFQDTINAGKTLLKSIGNGVKSATASAKDFYDPNKPAATETGNKIKKGVHKAVNAVKDFGKWLFTGKK